MLTETNDVLDVSELPPVLTLKRAAAAIGLTEICVRGQVNRRPAAITQADFARAIWAAKQVRAARLGGFLDVGMPR